MTMPIDRAATTIDDIHKRLKAAQLAVAHFKASHPSTLIHPWTADEAEAYRTLRETEEKLLRELAEYESPHSS
jgi:hypothetical protein